MQCYLDDIHKVSMPNMILYATLIIVKENGTFKRISNNCFSVEGVTINDRE